MKHNLKPEKVSPDELGLTLIPNGKIAITVDHWMDAKGLAAFGEDGLCPPRSISELTQRLAESITVSPDKDDAVELKSALTELKSSVEILETVISSIEADERT